MRGLPYEAKNGQVEEFLGHHAKNIVAHGIHIIYSNQGTPSGEALIQMKSEAAASLAANAMHHKNMELGKKKRYIEVFQCSLDDLPVVNPQPVMNPLAAPLNLPFGIPQTTPFVTVPGLLSNQLHLAPQFTVANNYQRLCASLMGQNVPQMAFGAPGLNLMPGQMNLLGQFVGQIPGQHIPQPNLFGNDQLYTAATHLQQQQVKFRNIFWFLEKRKGESETRLK